MRTYNEVVEVYKNLGQLFRTPGAITIRPDPNLTPEERKKWENSLHYALTSDRDRRTIVDIIDPGTGSIRKTKITNIPIENVTEAQVRDIFGAEDNSD